jgi:Reverse transcriptase (RNA-dependent DNA polymerase)
MQRAARRLHKRNPNLLLARTDINAFYEHVDIDILSGDLGQIGAPQWTHDTIDNFLRAFNGLSNVWGIPQGSDMSGMLANLYLTTLDAEIRRGGYHHFRYSDDIYIFGSDWSALRQVLINANRILRHRHLNLATSKTQIIESSAVAQEFEDMEKDAINYGVRVGIPGAAEDVRALFDRAVGKDPVLTRDFKFSLTQLARLDDAHAVGWLKSHLDRGLFTGQFVEV